MPITRRTALVSLAGVGLLPQVAAAQVPTYMRNGTDVSAHWMRLWMPNGDTWTFPIQQLDPLLTRYMMCSVQVTGTVLYRPWWG